MSERLPLSEKVTPAEVALLVIDIQNDFCAPDGVLGARGRDLMMIQSMLDHLEPTIQVARDANVLTLYTQQIYDRSKLSELQLEQYDLDGKFVICDVNTDGWHFYRISPPRGDVYVKHNFDAFSNNALAERLNTCGIKSVVVTGVDTHYCVETAIRRAFDLGYKVVVPEDLVATGSENSDMHERTLEMVRRGLGVLTTAAELQSIWQSVGE